jgi:hypothetical protein
VHPVGPIITAGMLLYPRDRAREVLRFYRDFMAEAPDEIGGGAALITAPPEPFVPADLQGQPALGIVFCYIGSVEDGQEAARPLRESTAPAVDLIQPMPYTAVQQMMDAGNPFGIHEYFKIDWLHDLPDEAIDLAVDHAERQPAPFAQVILAPMGGAVGRMNGDTALNIPEAGWAYFALTMWMDPSEDDRNRAWTRDFAETMRPFGLGTAAFPNFIETDEGTERLRKSYGPEKYERLVELKRQWDPNNLFRLNQNIVPS